MTTIFYHRKTVTTVLTAILLICAAPVYASGPQCSGCHASMAENPMMLPESPPADLLKALSTPCFNYAMVLEEYYYVEELFVTIEHHLHDLEEARYHVADLEEQLQPSRNFYRNMKRQPVVSLDDFVMKTGKLRFDLGKVYRPTKEHRIDQRNRHVLGVFLIGTLGLLILVVTGWRVASGRGEVHPPKTELGFDELQKKGGVEAVLKADEEENDQNGKEETK